MRELAVPNTKYQLDIAKDWPPQLELGGVEKVIEASEQSVEQLDTLVTAKHTTMSPHTTGAPIKNPPNCADTTRRMINERLVGPSRADDDPPMDDDYYPVTELAKPEIKKLSNTPALIREYEKLLAEEQKMADAPTKVSGTHYVLYEFDGEHYAVGPFNNETEAKIWNCGFTKGVEDSGDYAILGTVSGLIPGKDMTVIKPY